ncbi:MAG: cytochrome c [Pararhizobium sp.]
MCSNAVRSFGLILAVFAVGAGSAVTAQKTGDDVVRERQQDMKAMAAAARSINAMFKGTSPYDAKAFKVAAETIRAYSGERLLELFGAPATSEGSKASASIEAERPTFD